LDPDALADYFAEEVLVRQVLSEQGQHVVRQVAIEVVLLETDVRAGGRVS